MIGREQIQEVRDAVERLGSAAPDGVYDREEDLAALREAHWPIEDAAWRRSEVADVLTDWLDSTSPSTRRGAAVALGHIAPGILLREVAARAGPGPGPAEYEEGIGEAASALAEHYFGDGGCLRDLDQTGGDARRRAEEHRRLERFYVPISVAYPASRCVADLASLLNGIRPVRVT